jgi:hypothetical protein
MIPPLLGLELPSRLDLIPEGRDLSLELPAGARPLEDVRVLVRVVILRGRHDRGTEESGGCLCGCEEEEEEGERELGPARVRREGELEPEFGCDDATHQDDARWSGERGDSQR